MLGLLLTVGLAGSLVAMAAAGLEATEPFHPQLCWLREPPSKKAWALGRRRREGKNRRERKEGKTSWAFPRGLG